MGYEKSNKEAWFVLGLICAMVVGGIVGWLCPPDFVGVYSLVLIVAFILALLWTKEGSGLTTHQFVIAAIPLFLICSWCSYWVSYAGMVQK